MSRIGHMPISLPEGVKVDIKKNQVTVTGPKGSLARDFHPDMEIALEDNRVLVRRPTDQRHHKALHGLTRALLNNMVLGVTDGFQKKLEVQGVGYRVDLQGDQSLMLQLGFSHDVRITPPEGIQFEVEPRTKVITISGIDKELVGQVAATIRGIKKPEPYKGKGIKYSTEVIKRKEGKAGKGKK